jgi:hypothetical protein
MARVLTPEEAAHGLGVALAQLGRQEDVHVLAHQLGLAVARQRRHGRIGQQDAAALI